MTQTEQRQVLLEATLSRNNRSEISNQLKFIKACADGYYISNFAKSVIDSALAGYERVEGETEAIKIFKDVYIRRELTRRQISEKYYINLRTVYKKLNSVFEDLNILVFGIGGLKTA